MYAPRAGVPDSRADEVLELVGLADSAKRRVGGFSLGMRQRLGLATTLLGDPPVLLLDEPANGLDPEGIRWLRDLLRALATQGRTVLVSSHVLPEVQQTVDDIIVIARGRLVHSSPIGDLTRMAAPRVRVRAADPAALQMLVQQQGWRTHPVEHAGTEAADVLDLDAAAVGHAAFAAGVELHELRAHGASLEDVFLRLTSDQPLGATPSPMPDARPTGPAAGTNPGGAR